jgi:hypothetical protein
MNNNNRRRNFRPRPQKSGFRRRSNGGPQNQNGHFQTNNGNTNFGRNGSMSNPFNVEKTIQKFQLLAKEAQSHGDPVVVENYLQHADHYVRRLSELNLKIKNSNTPSPQTQSELNDTKNSTIPEKAPNLEEEEVKKNIS